MEAVIRRVRSDEGPVLKAVRLKALADSPSAFGSSYPAEADQPDEYWEGRAVLGAAGKSSVTYFAVIAGSVVGVVRASRPDAARLSVELGLDVGVAGTPTSRHCRRVGRCRHGLSNRRDRR